MRIVTGASGRAVPLRGNDIDTDRIMPARFLRAITFDGLEQHVFEDDRKTLSGSYRQAEHQSQPASDRDLAAATAERPVSLHDGRALKHPFDDTRYRGASVLVVNSNFGCGSSREHAPQGLQRWGINAIVGESFAEIFSGNSLMIGLPCVTASAADVRTLQDLIERNPDTEFRVDLEKGTCAAGDVQVKVSIPPNARDALITGAWDTTGLLLDRYEEVDALSRRLPYVSGF